MIISVWFTCFNIWFLSSLAIFSLSSTKHDSTNLPTLIPWIYPNLVLKIQENSQARDLNRGWKGLQYNFLPGTAFIKLQVTAFTSFQLLKKSFSNIILISFRALLIFYRLRLLRQSRTGRTLPLQLS